MASTIESVELAAMKLTPDERLILAHRLLASVDSEEADDSSPESDAEIRRRIAEVDAGLAQTCSAEEVFAEVDRRLKRVRSRRSSSSLA